MKTKFYSKQTIVWGLHWFFNIWVKHITMRFAGKPALILEYMENKYWKVEWQTRFKDLLEMLKEMWDNWKSPFVFYINDINKKEIPTTDKTVDVSHLIS